MNCIWQHIKEQWFFQGLDDTHLSVRERTNCLRRSMLITMLLITLVPLAVTATLSFHKYRQVLKHEVELNARWSAESARNTIEAFLERLQAAILVVAEAYTIEEFTNQATLDQIYNNLKAQHSGLVDLSIIGPQGIQQTYAGPFGHLSGKDYSDSAWYVNAITKRVHVSEVFMGYRNLPHFVIAVTKYDASSGQTWLVRASIDVQTLDRFLQSVDNEAIEDIYLVNEHGQLQSSSDYFGAKIGTKVVPAAPKKKGISLRVEPRDDTPTLRASGQVVGSPWILIQDQAPHFQRSSWISFKNQLLMIALGCSLVIVFFSFRIANLLAKNIRRSEEAREQLLHEPEQANKLASIGRLAAGVAHEINNPLAVINEKAGLMKDLLADADDFTYKEKFLKQLDSLQGAVSRSRTITHRLLGFARRMDTSYEKLKATDVIEEVLGFLEREASYQNIMIEKHFAEAVPEITSDRGKLQQIFLNILNNAITAIGEGGRILVRVVSLDQSRIGIDFEDNGPGMAPEVLTRIFEPFFTTKRGKDKPGTGLGLSITYGLVKKLGGDITVESEVGKGTTFHLTFPTQHTKSSEQPNDPN